MVTGRGRWKTVCARGAFWSLLGGPSTSPLAAMDTPARTIAARRLLSGLVAFAVILSGCTGHAEPVSTGVSAPSPSAPVQKGWVTDTASVLTSSDKERLSDLLAQYHSETHHQVAVLTVSTLAGETIDAYSLRVANTWQLGYRGIDNGILVTLAMQEKKVRIELGKGMERYISDEQAKEIIDQVMIPAFRKGDFAGGLEAGLKQLMTEARRFTVNPSDLQGK